jgi:hypothetical protein
MLMLGKLHAVYSSCSVTLLVLRASRSADVPKVLLLAVCSTALTDGCECVHAACSGN